MNLMEFHPDKSKYISTKKSDDRIDIGDTQLKITDNYIYLGDVISANGALKETIDLRSKACTAVVAELNAIIEETVAEDILIDAVILYHKSIIIPKLCLNSETWKLCTAELEEMEKIQNKSLKRMLRLPQGTPSIGLKAELGIMSIESIIAKRKLMFLHRMLNLPSSNITRRVLIEQLKMPGETWLNSIIKLCQSLRLNDNLETIKEYPKILWKNQVNQAVLSSDEDALAVWSTTSKKYRSKDLNLKKKGYINYLPPSLAMTILKTRLGMIEVKTNFKNMFSDVTCRKCKKEDETLHHVLKCGHKHNEIEEQILKNLDEILSDVDSSDPDIVMSVAKVIQKELQTLKNNKILVSTLESEPQATSSEEGHPIRQ